MDTDKKRVEQPREKWIVVEGQHEALVSQEVFKKANDNLVGLDVSGRNTGVRNLFFVCGYCGKGLRFSGRKKEKYLCRSRTQEAENDCQRVEVSRKEIEDAVLEQVRVMADMLMEERVVRREARKGNKASELDAVIADSTKELHSGKGRRCVCMSGINPGRSAGRNIWRGLKRAGFGWRNWSGPGVGRRRNLTGCRRFPVRRKYRTRN